MRFTLRLIAIALLASLSIGWKASKTASNGILTAPRNIYLYDTLMFISDSASGILVYANSSSVKPRLLQTIPIRGNSGMAYKDSILYADSYGSILALHIDTDTTFHVEKQLTFNGRWGMGADYYYYGDDEFTGCVCAGKDYSPVASADMTGGGGSGGSYAVFAVRDSFLYHVNYSSLVAYDISNPADPVETGRIYTNWTVETIHPTKDYLFLGTQQGMEVYGLTDPAKPNYISRIQHARSYDPVVVKDTLAFITLREGWWTTISNVLLSVSIKDIYNPKTLDTLSLVSPYGLAVSGSNVIVANGNSGYTLVNASNPSQMFIDASTATPNARDFIWIADTLYMMGMNHLTKYNCADPKSLSEIWKLP
ncbi:MAG: hypothetical protein JNL74_06200 [Fibrobacteres bacterium]|nr:hypothetical protein [Fibrobacterota bacterium]